MRSILKKHPTFGESRHVTSSRDKSTLEVLVAEDDPDDLYLLKQMLQQDTRKKYRIVHCDTLKQALAELRCQTFDVVLLDLNLGESQGLDTLKGIIAEGFKPPVIVLTGSSSESLGEEAIKHGAEDYLPKAEVNASLLSRSICYSIERHTLVLQLQQQATTDTLTGLPNRNALFDRLESAIESNGRVNDTLALALLDLDGFKQVNDSLGHRAGDDILRQIAGRLRKNLRRSDFAARLGGDEFVILFNHYRGTEELISVLEKKRDALVKPISLFANDDIHHFTLGVSIGAVEWGPTITAQKLISVADAAMYQSKHRGNNHITLGKIPLS